MNLTDEYFRYWGKARQCEDGGWNCHLLPYHCLDVAAVGRMILYSSPTLKNVAKQCKVEDDVLLNWATFIICIHDIGKFANGFQGLNSELYEALQGNTLRSSYREKHWSIGYRFMLNKHDVLFPESNRYFLSYWYAASVGHHGRPPQLTPNPQPLKFQFPQDIEDDAVNFINELKEIYSISGAPFKTDIDYYKIFPRISWLVSGITMLADWIGSNEEWFPFCMDKIPLKKYYETIAIKQAESAVFKSRVLPMPVSSQRTIGELFPKITSPTNFQRAVEKIELDDSPQLFIFEEETGRGKTEAALTLAHRIMAKGLAEGIYFALPTMATSNAMHERVENVYKQFYAENSNPTLILAHSASRMYLALEKALFVAGNGSDEDEINQDFPLWISDNRKKALFAHVGIGTIDQTLLAVLQAKHQALRLFGLSRKVLIVDEVHACDDYVFTLLCNLLKFHAAQGGSAILLSATLPIAMRKKFLESYVDGLDLQFKGKLNNQYPLLTKCSALNFQEIPVKRDKHSRKVKIQSINCYEDIFRTLMAVLEKGKCACWIRNTVYDAITAYQDAQKHFGKENIILFHARFALGDRLDIEMKIKKMFGTESIHVQRKGKLVITTQVVEQSLDLDFDFMVSDLAPIDLIIQRAGRLHRHNRNTNGDRIDDKDERGEATMAIYLPVMEDEPKANWYKELLPKAAKVYPHHGQLWLTADWLVKHRKFTMPADARKMIESVYGEEAQALIPVSFERNENTAHGNDGAAVSMAHFHELHLDTGYMADMLTWMLDDKTPTRLGELTVMVRLACRENGKLVPLIRRELDFAWELSHVSVYRKMIAYEDETYREAIDETKEEMSDKGKYCMIVVLEPREDGYIGKALNIRGEVMTVHYDKTIGLRVNKGENDESDS